VTLVDGKRSQEVSASDEREWDPQSRALKTAPKNKWTAMDKATSVRRSECMEIGIVPVVRGRRPGRDARMAAEAVGEGGHSGIVEITFMFY